MRPRLKGGIARALAALGVFALTAGVLLGSLRRGLFDSDAFADRLAGSLSDRRVSAYVAELMTNAVLREKPDLVAVRPLLAAAADGLASSDMFALIARTAARRAHAALFSPGGRNLLLSVPDLGVILRGALAGANPELAARVPARLSAVVASVGASSASRFIVDLWKLGRAVAWLAIITAGAGVALLVAGIALAPHRTRALRRAALDLLLAALILAILEPVGRGLVKLVPGTALGRDAAVGLYDAFTVGLRRLALVLAGVGLLFSAAAQSLIAPDWLLGAARGGWAWLTRPRPSRGDRLRRGTAFVLAGLLAILFPSAALTGLALASGACLTFVGVEQLFQLVLRPQTGARPAEERGLEAPPRTHVVALLCFACVAALAIAWLGRPRETPIVRVAGGCNGDERLCARRLDQVAFAATHNAMSAADAADWLFAEQEHGLAAQLQAGVRAFLVDVHAGFPVSGRVKTDFGEDPSFLRQAEEAIGKEGTAAALRIRERLVGPATGPHGLYLCHGFCELGATAFVQWLGTLRDFLVANPREVVILVLEDYVPPREIAAAFADSGLGDLVFRGAPRPPWPTLAEMAESGQRVLTFLESGTRGVDWLHPAFASIQETPYRFLAPSQFSCAPNRGGTAGSLFQLNHWIETAPASKPSNAAVVNAHDFLLDRARLCQKQRSHLPNIVAVDFYREGDLTGVVRVLNGLDSPREERGPGRAE
jgi:hypothetical protein